MGLKQLNFERMTKVETAIERLREYEPPEGYFLAFSGGKDSICIYNLAIEAGVRFDAHYSVSPIDPPELHQFITEHYPDVIWDITVKGFWKLVDKKGLPNRWSRWCCTKIKEKQGKGRTVVLGIRWEESIGRRKNYKSYIEQIGKRPPTYRLMPILDWNEAEVWEYIDGKKLAYPSLYDEGYSRIGCIMCPLAGQALMRRDAIRYPKIERLWWRSCQRYYNSRPQQQERFESAEEVWRWWIGKEPPNCLDGEAVLHNKSFNPTTNSTPVEDGANFEGESVEWPHTNLLPVNSTLCG